MLSYVSDTCEGPHLFTMTNKVCGLQVDRYSFILAGYSGVNGVCSRQ